MMKPLTANESTILENSFDSYDAEPVLYCSLIPLLIAGAVMAGAGIAKSMSGMDDNNSQAIKPNMPASSFNFNGDNQGTWDQRAAALQSRQAYQADYANANNARALAGQSRDAMNDALSNYRNAANGTAPSAAQVQMQQGVEAAQRAAASNAAGARGGGLARAVANRFAAQQQGDLATKAVGDNAVLRAQEMAAARQGYAGLAGSMRGYDNQSQSLEAQMAQYQSDAQMKNRAQNDNAAANAYQLGHDASKAQQSGQENYYTVDSANDLKTQAMNMGVAADNAQNQRNVTSGLISGGAGMIAGGLNSSPKDTSSDETKKTNIEPADKKMQSFLDAIQAYNFDYKNPQAAGAAPGQHTGVMAQDLQKSEEGARLVHQTPHGLVVDNREAVPTLMAALAHQNKRINSMEDAFRAMSKGSK